MAEQGQYVVVGSNPLAYRVVRALVTRFDSEVTVLVPDATERFAREMATVRAEAAEPDDQPRGSVRVLEAGTVDQAVLDRAGAARAEAVALLDQDDGINFSVALLLRETWPDLRVVVRIFDEALGRALSDDDPNCRVLSASRHAAPEVVAAATGRLVRLPIPGGSFVAVSEDSPLRRTMTLFAVDAAGQVQVLPDENLVRDPLRTDEPGRPYTAKWVLAQARPEDVLTLRDDATEPDEDERTQEKPTALEFLRTMVVASGRNLLVSAGVLLGVILLGAAMLHLFGGRDVGEALYEAALPSLAGSDPDPEAPAVVKVTQVALTVVSVAVIPWVTAVVVDGVVRTQLLLARNAPLRRLTEHVVVVGLSDLGTRVVRALDAGGIPVIAVDVDENARGVAVARARGVPVVVGDARRPSTLRAAYVDSAQAVVVVTAGGTRTIAIAFAARSLARALDAPAVLRVVVRIFDRDVARRVRRKIGEDHAAGISASFLAAPWFLAALMGEEVRATVPYLDRSLLLVELAVEAGRPLEGRDVSGLHAPGAYRLVAVRAAERSGGGGGQVFEPTARRPLQAGDTAYVLATRHGLAQVQALVGRRTEVVPRPRS